MIKLNVSAANITVAEKETLTEGRVGLLCQFSFTDEWAGLAKTAVFDGADSRDVILKSDTVAVPAECLSAEGYSLSVGVYGKNSAGDIVIPTVYATVGKIQRSAYPSGKEPAEPTPDVVAQIQQAAANAEAMARSVRDDADLGKFAGPQGPKGDTGPAGADGADGGWYTPAVTQPDENTMRLSFTPSQEGMPDVEPTDVVLPGGSGGGGSGEDGGYYTPSVTQNAENVMEISYAPSKEGMPEVEAKEITLPAGPTGAAGADGKSAYEYAVEGGYTGTEAEFAAKLAAEKFANPQALTFTGAVEGSYDGSEAVTVEIPSGGGDVQWELLADVTTEEEVSHITVSLENPGTFKRFAIYAKFVGVSTNQTSWGLYVDITSGQWVMAKETNLVEITSLNQTIDLWIRCNIDVTQLFNQVINTVKYNNDNLLKSGNYTFRVTTIDTIIDTLQFGIQNWNGAMGVGSEFRVYGVRSR